MEDSQAVSLLAALAQETRLRIVRSLVQVGEGGLAAGRLAEVVAVSASNLSFHLKELERAGLITSRRRGASIIYSASYATLSALAAFLGENCCGGGKTGASCC